MISSSSFRFISEILHLFFSLFLLVLTLHFFLISIFSHSFLYFCIILSDFLFSFPRHSYYSIFFLILCLLKWTNSNPFFLIVYLKHFLASRSFNLKIDFFYLSMILRSFLKVKFQVNEVILAAFDSVAISLSLVVFGDTAQISRNFNKFINPFACQQHYFVVGYLTLLEYNYSFMPFLLT